MRNADQTILEAVRKQTKEWRDEKDTLTQLNNEQAQEIDMKQYQLTKLERENRELREKEDCPKEEINDAEIVHSPKPRN